jgi:hypothetical protein
VRERLAFARNPFPHLFHRFHDSFPYLLRRITRLVTDAVTKVSHSFSRAQFNLFYQPINNPNPGRNTITMRH